MGNAKAQRRNGRNGKGFVGCGVDNRAAGVQNWGMEYDWDELKLETNLEKHGLDFNSVYAFQWDTAVTRVSARRGELRLLSYGYIGERLHVVIYVIRERKRRIISLRKANARERRDYERDRA